MSDGSCPEPVAEGSVTEKHPLTIMFVSTKFASKSLCSLVYHVNPQRLLPKVLESSTRAAFGVEGVVLNGPWAMICSPRDQVPGHRDGSLD